MNSARTDAAAAGPVGTADAVARLTRRVTAESIVLAGGGCAILLQLADARVAHGVARHSAFDSAPLRRLDGTLAYVMAVVHGDDRDRDAVGRAVEAAHAPVHGAALEPNSAGPAVEVAYNANDPDAQRWVAATLYWSAREAHRRAFGSLSAADHELLLQGFAPVGAALRMDPASWPGSVAEFDAWFDGVVATTQVTAAARESFAKLRRASGAPWWLRPILPLVWLIAVGMLPTRIRFAFEPGWRNRHRFAVELAWALIVPGYRLLPRVVRTLPVRLVLGRLRRRSAKRAASPGYHERHATTTTRRRRWEGDDDARGGHGAGRDG